MPEIGSDKMFDLVYCLLLAVLTIGGLWAVGGEKGQAGGGGEGGGRDTVL